MAWTTPKVNWTESNYYNAADLNRVESNTTELASYIASYSVTVATATAITNRTNVTIEYFDSLNRVENNIALCQQVIGAIPSGYLTPKTTWASLGQFSYIDANRLENNLLLLYTMAQNIKGYLKYCGQYGGTYYAGQDNSFL